MPVRSIQKPGIDFDPVRPRERFHMVGVQVDEKERSRMRRERLFNPGDELPEERLSDRIIGETQHGMGRDIEVTNIGIVQGKPGFGNMLVEYRDIAHR